MEKKVGVALVKTLLVALAVFGVYNFYLAARSQNEFVVSLSNILLALKLVVDLSLIPFVLMKKHNTWSAVVLDKYFIVLSISAFFAQGLFMYINGAYVYALNSLISIFLVIGCVIWCRSRQGNK